MKKGPTIKTYIIGYVLSIILTLMAFGMTQIHINSNHLFISHELVIPLLLVLALIQLIVQLVFFLHVLHEDKPRWNLVFFVGTFSLVFLVVAASLWIMGHLNYNMTPKSASRFIIQDEGIHH